MMNVAITGASGLIGSRLIEVLSPSFSIIPFSSSSLNITDNTQLSQTIEQTDFDILLHLAGYTNVDKAEIEREQAYEINVQGTKNLYEAVTKKNKRFIYISTDFVFDGTQPPYTEDSVPHPLGYYAQTKYEGEQMLGNMGTIVRISYPYGKINEHKLDFVHRIKALLEAGKELTMITDGEMTPTYIDDIAFALKNIMENNREGLYHIVGSRSYSPFEVGKMIARQYGFENQIKPITYKEYSQGKAPRPQHGIIQSTKNNFYPMKSFEEGLMLIK